MKRYYLLAVMMFSALSVFAETTISRTFLGCTLGKSTSKEVISTLTSMGLELESDTILGAEILAYSFEGVSYNHEGMDFHSFSTLFVNDTLFAVCMQDSCSENCSDFSALIQTNLETKYGHLQTADGTSLLNLVDSIKSTDAEIWFRQDRSTMVGTFSSDSSFACWYVDKDAYYRLLLAILKTLGDETSRLLSNWAEENKVYGVAGVKFGDDRETVRRAIALKSEKLSDSDSHSLCFYKTRIGGTTYDFATFYFVQGKGLISVHLQKPFSVWKQEEAIMSYENIVAQYRRKYSNFKVITDKEEDKLCTCGAYVDGYDYHPIFISFHKSLSQGGDLMYYVIVSYYEGRRANLYDDEI